MRAHGVTLRLYLCCYVWLLTLRLVTVCWLVYVDLPLIYVYWLLLVGYVHFTLYVGPLFCVLPYVYAVTLDLVYLPLLPCCYCYLLLVGLV